MFIFLNQIIHKCYYNKMSCFNEHNTLLIKFIILTQYSHYIVFLKVECDGAMDFRFKICFKSRKHHFELNFKEFESRRNEPCFIYIFASYNFTKQLLSVREGCARYWKNLIWIKCKMQNCHTKTKIRTWLPYQIYYLIFNSMRNISISIMTIYFKWKYFWA